MFPQTTESFIRTYAESTLDRHVGETEEERVIREGNSYQEASRFSRFLRGLGHLFLGLGQRLDELGTPQATESLDASVTKRTAHSHAH